MTFTQTEHERYLASKLDEARRQSADYCLHLVAVVTAMRRADPEWCACHGETPIDDETWDAVLGAAEDCLDDHASGTGGDANV